MTQHWCGSGLRDLIRSKLLCCLAPRYLYSSSPSKPWKHLTVGVIRSDLLLVTALPYAYMCPCAHTRTLTSHSHIHAYLHTYKHIHPYTSTFTQSCVYSQLHLPQTLMHRVTYTHIPCHTFTHTGHTLTQPSICTTTHITHNHIWAHASHADISKRTVHIQAITHL